MNNDLSDEAFWSCTDGMTRLQAWQECRRRVTEKLATWMIAHSIATGHGDDIDDLLKELEWQLQERLPPDYLLQVAAQALRSYQYGNSSPDLAKEIADQIDELHGTKTH